MLLDCGATSLSALKRLGIDPGEIAAVFVSHLHGDHFGGLPFLILDGQFSRRTRPLAVVGPPGTATRLADTMECLFPGSSTAPRRFAVEVTELAPGTSQHTMRGRRPRLGSGPPQRRPGPPPPPGPGRQDHRLHRRHRVDRRDRRGSGGCRPADRRGVLPRQAHPVPPAASRPPRPPGPADRPAHHPHPHVRRHARRPARAILRASARRTDHHPVELAEIANTHEDLVVQRGEHH